MGTSTVNFTFKYRLVYLLKVLKVRCAPSTEPLYCALIKSRNLLKKSRTIERTVKFPCRATFPKEGDKGDQVGVTVIPVDTNYYPDFGRTWQIKNIFVH